MSFIDFSFLDILDILLVAFLLYQLYRLIQGTVAINVLIGVAAIFLVWKVVQALQMELLSEILGQFIGVGVIALVIVFQQEIRRFLLVIGSTNFVGNSALFRSLSWASEKTSDVPVEELVEACQSMGRKKTGALIIIERTSRLGFYEETGTRLNSIISAYLLESIFNKYSPLHDGAMIIRGENILAAGCILPVTEKRDVPSRFGLRHRAAMGIAEKTDALAVIVSEETGDLSLADGEEFINKLSPDALIAEIKKRL